MLALGSSQDLTGSKFDPVAHMEIGVLYVTGTWDFIEALVSVLRWVLFLFFGSSQPYLLLSTQPIWVSGLLKLPEHQMEYLSYVQSSVVLCINVLVPFLYEFNLLLAFFSHALPFDQLSPLRLLFDPIAHGRYHHHQTEEASRRDLVVVQRHRKRDANQYARGHDNGEDHGAEILDGVKDE